jgi:hypothetical protein
LTTELVATDRESVLETLTQEIRGLRSRAAGDLWQMGIKLAKIQRDSLWAGSYESFEDYLAKAVSMSRSSAYDAIRVSAHFNEEIALRYGMDKVLAVIRWIEATPTEERPGDVFAAKIRVRGSKGRFLKVSLHQATAEQVREAVGLLKDAKRGGQAIPQAVQARVARLNAALGGKRERVKVSRGRDGRLLASFTGIPMEELASFALTVAQSVEQDEAGPTE